jgi:outer membrane protein assembly factor BamB
MRRRLLIALAVLVVLAAGLGAAYVIHRQHEDRNIRGSSTVEFVPTKPPTVKQLSLTVPWPMFGLTTTRTRSVALAVAPPFRKLWTYHAGSLVEFPPSIGYGRMYVSTNSGKFAAVNLKTGRTAWKYLAHRCVAASPAIGPQHHGSVFAVFLNRPPCNAQTGGHGTNGAVIDFGVGFGKIRWTKIIGPSETSPLLLGNRLYVGDWNGNVWAIDARNGKTIWRFHTGGAVKGGVAFAGGKLYVGSYDGHLYCLSLAGKKIWKAAAEPRLYGHSQFYSTPAVAYGRVYIGSTDGRVYSYGATTGKLRWSHSTGGYVYGSPAVAHDLVFAGSFSKRFFAFDAATGDEKWSFTANGPIAGSATVVGDLVYFATLKRRTYALNVATGKLVWTYPDGKYSPVVAARGRLFLVGYGQVYGMVPR